MVLGIGLVNSFVIKLNVVFIRMCNPNPSTSKRIPSLSIGLHVCDLPVFLKQGMGVFV